MADRLISVTNGTGADFTKETMLESEYQKQFAETGGNAVQPPQNEAPPLQTEYDQAALKGGASSGGDELPTESQLSKLSKTELTKQAASESVEISPEMTTNAKIVEGILAARK